MINYLCALVREPDKFTIPAVTFGYSCLHRPLFSGPDRAIGPTNVCESVSGQ